MTGLRTSLVALMAVVLLGLIAEAALAAPSGRTNGMDFAKSTDCAAAHKKFQRSYIPLFFGVADGGKMCVYSFCAAACRMTNARSMTVYRCEKESGTTCQLYDQNDAIPGLTSN